MATATKRMSIFRALFGSGVDIEDYETVALPKELADARKAIEAREKEVRKGFNSNKGGIAPKINPKTEEAMRAMHSKVLNREQKTSDIEIGD